MALVVTIAATHLDYWRTTWANGTCVCPVLWLGVGLFSVSFVVIGALLARGEQVFGYVASERVFANPIDHNRAGLF